MQRNEIILTSVLVALILAGTVYESYRGADKTAEVIITHPGTTPLDAQNAPTPQLIPTMATFPASATPTPQIPEPTSAPNDPFLIFINDATVEKLQTLSGIGPVLAQRIFLDRQRAGRYTSLEDLLRVTGIGEAKLKAMIDSFTMTVRTPSPTPHLPANSPIRSWNSSSLQTPTPWRKSAISLNQASREDLLSLPGFGEMLVDSLIQARMQQSGFRTWEDVGKIAGIGEKRLQELQQRFFLPSPR